MGSKSVSESVNGRGVSATISWDTGPEVYIEITGNAGYGNQAGWRIRGKNPDTTQYFPDPSEGHSTMASEGVFDAVDGTTYYFQAVWGTENGTSDGTPFTVNFDSGDSGDDDDTGGDIVTSSNLYLFEGEGTTLTVKRGWSDEATTGNLLGYGSDNPNTVYWENDRFQIFVEALPGYELEYFDLDGTLVPFSSTNITFSSTDGIFKLLVDDDATISTSAKPLSTVHIYDGAEFAPYYCYIYSDSDWNLYSPYIYDGENWCEYN